CEWTFGSAPGLARRKEGCLDRIYRGQGNGRCVDPRFGKPLKHALGVHGRVLQWPSVDSRWKASGICIDQVRPVQYVRQTVEWRGGGKAESRFAGRRKTAKLVARRKILGVCPASNGEAWRVRSDGPSVEWSGGAVFVAKRAVCEPNRTGIAWWEVDCVFGKP